MRFAVSRKKSLSENAYYDNSVESLLKIWPKCSENYQLVQNDKNSSLKFEISHE